MTTTINALVVRITNEIVNDQEVIDWANKNSTPDGPGEQHDAYCADYAGNINKLLRGIQARYNQE